jgi:hypothetical protein
VDAPSAYLGAWEGAFAEYAPEPPDSEHVGPAEMEELERRASNWLLSESCDRDVEEVVSSIAYLAKPSPIPWRMVYLIGDLALSNPKERLDFLQQPDLNKAIALLSESLAGVAPPDSERVEQVANFMDYAVEEGLERAVQFLDAASVIARGCQPVGHTLPVEDVLRVRSELVALCKRAHALVDEVKDVSVAIGRQQKSRT